MTRTRTARVIERLGQLLIVGFDDMEISPRLTSLLTRLQPAGVILFARNIQSPEQTWQLLRECQKCGATPLFTCVDLEGGDVDRFRDALGPRHLLRKYSRPATAHFSVSTGESTDRLRTAGLLGFNTRGLRACAGSGI